MILVFSPLSSKVFYPLNIFGKKQFPIRHTTTSVSISSRNKYFKKSKESTLWKIMDLFSKNIFMHLSSVLKLEHFEEKIYIWIEPNSLFKYDYQNCPNSSWQHCKDSLKNRRCDFHFLKIFSFLNDRHELSNFGNLWGVYHLSNKNQFFLDFKVVKEDVE